MILIAIVGICHAIDITIIGGEEVNPHTEPHILSIQKQNNHCTRNNHFCGGSVISESYGITAAHCHHSRVLAVGGVHNIHRLEPTQQRRKAEFLKHSQYNPATLSNDIAILKMVDEPFYFNNYLMPIIMPPQQDIEWLPHNKKVRICGWGTISYPNHNYPSGLHCVDTKIIDLEHCNDSDLYDGSVLRGMFCAGELRIGGTDSCQGDSGGPAKLDNMVVGVTSWGIGCGEKEHPGVYTDVAYYSDWVHSHTQMYDHQKTED